MKTPVLEVHRSSIGETRLVEQDLGSLADGSVRLEVERFSITANTVTYAQFGDMLGYWDFYPSGDGTFGRVPAMGWARVIESNHDGASVGSRLYGWFPMAGHVDLRVGVTSTGLRDDGDHRKAHAPIYRTFEATDRDPMHPSRHHGDASDDEMRDLEDRHALLRGLFLTGSLADGFFEASSWFDADHAVVLSASSKTAIGFADCASRHDGLRVVGITSPRNVDFVSDLGIYDSILTYDEVASSVPDDAAGAVLIDMAGNGAAVAALHDALGDRIGYSMIVGNTHHDAPPAAPSSGPTPEMFFAPTALQTMAEQGLDAEAFQTAMPDALASFVERSRQWLDVERRNGPEGAASTWSDVHGGVVPPSTGRIASLHD